MEWSPTVVVDPLTTDQWTLWLPTPVTLATLSLEVPPGLVGVMECGVGQLQFVCVSGTECQLFSSWMLYTRTEITCSDLVLPTLMVSYNDGSPGNRPVDTGATYSCNNGYILTGGATRVCVNGGSWSGSTPTCQGELCTLSTTLVHWFNSCRTHWTTHHLSWPHRTNQWSDNLQSNNHPQTRGSRGHTNLLEWIRTLHYQH